MTKIDPVVETDTIAPEPLESAEPQPEISTTDAKRHFLTNTISNIIYFLFNIATSFFMVRYQIRHLGIANYGMVTLANSFVSYTQVLTVVLISTLFRFVMLHIAKGDMKTARIYFNTQFTAVVWFIVAFLPIAAVVSYCTPFFLRIPPGQNDNTRILFFLMYVSFLTALLSIPFRLAQYTMQRFDVSNWIDMGNQIARYSMWIVMFALFVPLTWHIGLGFTIGAVVTLCCSITYARPLMRRLRPSARQFNWPRFVEMAKTGTWIVVSHIGTLIYLSIDALIINRMLGPTSVGKYCTILSIAVMLRSLFSTMAGMMTPLAVASYAREDYAGLGKQMARAVKFVSLGSSLPLAAVCGLAAPFLTWWLGPQFKVLWPLVWWLLAHLLITSGVEPLHSVKLAANRMAVPGTMTILGGILKLVAAILLVKHTSLGFYGVAIPSALSLVALHTIFTPIYVGSILKMSSWPFYKALIPSVMVFAGASAGTAYFAMHTNLATFPRLAMSVVTIFVVCGAVIYFFALNGEDRQFLKGVIRNRGKRQAEAQA